LKAGESDYTMTDIQNIALRHLELSPLNVRKTRRQEDIEALATNIDAVGLLQNLRVHTQERGMYAVAIGGSRLLALQLLLKQKKITEDFQVPCEVRPANDPSLSEASLSENVMRSRMHPADEFESFSRLISEGSGPAEIGSRFGQTARYVEQRLKLAAVSPKLIALLRKGDMTLDQLEAFTIEPDVKKQERVWKSLDDRQRQNGRGDTIRNALTEQKIDSDDRRVKFIGLKTYTDAGGSLIPDLFDRRDENAGYLTDAGLLERLVFAKLNAEAEKLSGEGWKWTLAVPAMPYDEESKFQRLHAERAEPTDDAKAEIAKLETEATSIQEAHGEQPEDEVAANRLDEIGERYNELIDGEEVWAAEQKSVAGVILVINQTGELDIRRGMVKPEDKKAAQALTRGAGAGRTATKAEKPKGGLPAALVTELTSHKTKAAQLVLSDNPAVALKAVTHALAIRLFYDGYTDEHTSLGIKANEPTFPHAMRDELAKSAPAKKLDAIEKAWRKKLPKEPDGLWAWIEKQPKATVESLLAVCAALTVDFVQVAGAEAKASSLALAKAMKLNVADHWEANAENYFSRVPRKHLLAELGAAIKPTLKKQIEGMKRDAAAKAIQTELRGKKWLPPVMRNE
jgi:ParB family chromosome partitioning protein